MSTKQKPNIITPFNDRARFKALVQEVINDTTIFTHIPDSISLDGVLFTLTFSNKKFVFEDMKVDNLADYIDLYLQGVKKSAETYSVTDNGTNIILETNQSITMSPGSIVSTDFLVKGKIVSR